MKLLLSMAADGALVVLPQPAIMLVPVAVQRRHGLHCGSRPGQLCAHQEAPDSVEEQVASAVGDFSRDVSQ